MSITPKTINLPEPRTHKVENKNLVSYLKALNGALRDYMRRLKSDADAVITDHGALTGKGDDDHTQYHNDTRAVTWLAANHETTYTHSDIALNTTHKTSNGTDHGYIDQDVKVAASPTFVNLTISSLGLTADEMFRYMFMMGK
jgi:hypothetical protein